MINILLYDSCCVYLLTARMFTQSDMVKCILRRYGGFDGSISHLKYSISRMESVVTMFILKVDA